MEIDAAFALYLDGKCDFIPIRRGLDLVEVPLTLRRMAHLTIEEIQGDPRLFVNRVYGISRKPPLGAMPEFLRRRTEIIGLIVAASAMVQLFVERSQHGDDNDPQLEPNDIRSATELADDDVIDAIDDLEERGFVTKHVAIGSGNIGFAFVTPRGRLFSEYDACFMPWDPAEDALQVAADLVNKQEHGANVRALADEYGWQPRRMNPAIHYLIDNGLVKASEEIGSHPWACHWVLATPRIRRFVRAEAITACCCIPRSAFHLRIPISTT